MGLSDRCQGQKLVSWNISRDMNGFPNKICKCTEKVVSHGQTGNIQKYWVWHTSGTELFHEAIQVLPQLTMFLSNSLWQFF